MKGDIKISQEENLIKNNLKPARTSSVHIFIEVKEKFI